MRVVLATLVDNQSAEFDRACRILGHRAGDPNTIAQPEDGIVYRLRFDDTGSVGYAWISRAKGIIAIDAGGDPTWYAFSPETYPDYVDLMNASFNDELFAL
jgi:hypothetical protein